jgi:hypothetical protein
LKFLYASSYISSESTASTYREKPCELTGISMHHGHVQGAEIQVEWEVYKVLKSYRVKGIYIVNAEEVRL